MSSCSSPFCRATERHFDVRVAARDLARYRRQGPNVTTRLLRDGLHATGPIGSTLLDIGAGVGALTFELLDEGVQQATGVDASTAYVAAAREEAERRGRAHQVQWIHGDFVSLAPQLPVADVVALDRVVCCYPAFEPLLHEALRRAARRFAVSYPRDRWYVRAVFALENALRRLTRNPFRTIVHPAAAMEQLVRQHGFHRVSRRLTIAWSVDVYAKADAGASSGSSGAVIQTESREAIAPRLSRRGES